jgi:hypothetical protein
VDTLEGLSTGIYVVTTKSGTRHLIDLDRNVAIRQGVEGHEWNSSSLTSDGYPLHFSLLIDPTVGKRMRIENSDEWRLTSMVVSIEAYQAPKGAA